MEITSRTCVCGSDRDELAQKVKTMPKWVSVDERLPEEDGSTGESIIVLISTRKGVMAGFLEDVHDSSSWSDIQRIYGPSPTHWMPLPEPPKTK